MTAKESCSLLGPFCHCINVEANLGKISFRVRVHSNMTLTFSPLSV